MNRSSDSEIKTPDILAVIDSERDRWRKRENELSGTQDLYAIGEAIGAQRALWLLRERFMPKDWRTDPDNLEQIRTNEKYLQGLINDFAETKTEGAMTGKYLITTNAWFYGPNGKEYRAAWGTVEILSDEVLGVKTNRNATNWYAKVGTEENHVIIAGCQVHYAIRCQEKPAAGNFERWGTHEGKVVVDEFPNPIYTAE